MNMRIITAQRYRVYPLLSAILWGSLLVFFVRSTLAQGEPVAIQAENIDRLASIAEIDFAELPSQIGKVDLGWFAITASGDLFAVITRDDTLVIMDAQGNLVDSYSIPGGDGLPATVLDAAFNAGGDMLASVHVDGTSIYVVYRWFRAHDMGYCRILSTDVPLRIWAETEVWLEVSSDDPQRNRYVVQLLPYATNGVQLDGELTCDERRWLPSGPENDSESFLRIGRIKPPFALTVTQDWLLKRWNLESGEITATAQLDALPGAGQLSASGDHFIWRDPESTALYLFDFETGENRMVAPLNGAYVPFLFLTPAADAAIGVNVGLEPVVVAWDTMTGVRYDLGAYRACNRQPDMVRLSGDGTTLVIGCDTGLDIWRIEREGM